MDSESIIEMARRRENVDDNQPLEQPTAAELLRQTRVVISPETYFLVGLSFADWTRILEQPELSSTRQVPYMVLRDAHQVTLLIDEIDWRQMRHAARDARVENSFRLVTLDLELSWNTVGYLAHITAILAQAGVTIGALSAFSRDHLLIKQDELGTAMRALSPHVAELC